ncbi:7 transmembrane receptor [Ostertagia ostertagi]
MELNITQVLTCALTLNVQRLYGRGIHSKFLVRALASPSEYTVSFIVLNLLGHSNPDDMVIGTIHSIRESVINISETFSTEAPSMTQNTTIIPTVELVLGTITYLVIITMTVVGNTLVVVAVFSYRPLKKVQNYFLVSLAASDLAVAIFVMPLHVVKFLADGRWLLGIPICQLFTTADILLCTSSILNLCAIAIDRYCAIHDPINYAQKRTLRFVCCVIITTQLFQVWVLSVIISVPPLIGWNDWSSQKLRDHCELSSERAFVVFSASGSFFLPLLVMVVVYVKIFISARQRIRTNRGRSALMRIQNASVEERGDRRSSKRFSVESAKAGGRVGEKTPLVHTEGTSVVTVVPSSLPDGVNIDQTTRTMRYHNNGCARRDVAGKDNAVSFSMTNQ